MHADAQAQKVLLEPKRAKQSGNAVLAFPLQKGILKKASSLYGRLYGACTALVRRLYALGTSHGTFHYVATELRSYLVT